MQKVWPLRLRHKFDENLKGDSKSLITNHGSNVGLLFALLLVIIVIMTSKRYLQQMTLDNSSLCDYCGETENVGQVLINCMGNGVDRNIKDGCKNYNLISVSAGLLY